MVKYATLAITLVITTLYPHSIHGKLHHCGKLYPPKNPNQTPDGGIISPLGVSIQALLAHYIISISTLDGLLFILLSKDWMKNNIRCRTDSEIQSLDGSLHNIIINTHGYC